MNTQPIIAYNKRAKELLKDVLGTLVAIRIAFLDEDNPDHAKAIKHIDDEVPLLLQALSNSPLPEWINAKDRLPEREQSVLAHLDDGFIAVVEIEADGEWGLWADSGNVTHWMPLPQPPMDKG